MARLVIDARESGTSTGRYIDKLIEYLAKLKPGFGVIVLTKSHRLDFFKDIAPEFEVLGSDYKEFSVAEQLGFAHQLYGLKPNLVHFSMTQQPLLYFGRSITTMHDLTTARFYNPAKFWPIFKFKQSIYRIVIFWAAHKSKTVITPSQFVKNDLAKFASVSPAKIKVIYEAADQIAAKPETIGKLKGKKFLLYVGRPQPHKNLERLIQAYEILAKNYDDLYLVLAGRTDKLYERLADKHPNPKIIFTDFINEAKLRWMYENCAAYVFPSLSEGFGLPGLEAMAHGAPVVSSNRSCLPEIYGEAAVYFDPADTADMAAKIGTLLADADLRQKMIAKGHTQASKYSWAKMAAQTLKIYEQYLN